MKKDEWVMAAFNYSPTKDYQHHPTILIGEMDKECPDCRALKWPGEAKGMCCTGGKVKLTLIGPPPEFVQNLLTGDTPDARDFQKLCAYNYTFAMTSFGLTRLILVLGSPPSRSEVSATTRIGACKHLTMKHPS